MYRRAVLVELQNQNGWTAGGIRIILYHNRSKDARSDSLNDDIILSQSS